MAYDSKCYELAELFLSDEPRRLNTKAHREELAQHIQDAIEDYLRFLDQEPEPRADAVPPWRKPVST